MEQNIIYLLVNKVNKKFYIGQTWQSLESRWERGNGYRSSTYLNNAIKKYGKENFEYKILTICYTQKDADYWENFYIKEYDSRNHKKGYNIKEGGSHGRLSEDTKIKLSKPKSEKAKANMRANHADFSGENHPLFNKHHTEASKEKMRQSVIAKEYNPLAKLSKKDVIKIKKLMIKGKNNKELSIMFGVQTRTIQAIRREKNWWYVRVDGFHPNIKPNKSR